MGRVVVVRAWDLAEQPNENLCRAAYEHFKTDDMKGYEAPSEGISLRKPL